MLKPEVLAELEATAMSTIDQCGPDASNMFPAQTVLALLFAARLAEAYWEEVGALRHLVDGDGEPVAQVVPSGRVDPRAWIHLPVSAYWYDKAIAARAATDAARRREGVE